MRLFTIPLAFLLALALPLAGCLDPEGIEPEYTCDDDDGRCWAYVEGWASWAETSEGYKVFEDALALDLLVPLEESPPGQQCYSVVASVSTPCVVHVDGVPLLGLPVDQLPVESAECAGIYPWYQTVMARGECRGVIDGVAIVLDLDREIPDL